MTAERKVINSIFVKMLLLTLSLRSHIALPSSEFRRTELNFLCCARPRRTTRPRRTSRAGPDLLYASTPKRILAHAWNLAESGLGTGSMRRLLSETLLGSASAWRMASVALIAERSGGEGA